jgi:hypothetical protein
MAKNTSSPTQRSKSPYGRSRLGSTTNGASTDKAAQLDYSERVRQLEEENAELADHIFLSGPERTERTPSEIPNGLSSRDDPNKKFWLRNEVIGFERHIAQLSGMLNEAEERAMAAEDAAAVALSERKAMQDEVQAAS